MATEGSGLWSEWGGWSGIADNLNPDNLGGWIKGEAPSPSTFYGGGIGSRIGSELTPTSEAVKQAANDYRWKHGQQALNALGAKPYRFNAPLHPSMRKVPGGSPYDVHHGSGDLRVDWPEKSGRKPWNWRVGQLVADSASAAFKPGDYRYGFRFLYNPSSIQFATPLTSKYSPNALSDTSGGDVRMLPQGSISVELFLNRIKDVTQPTDDYQMGKGQKISPEDLAELQERGTMYDIDYLYRTINGMWSLDETAGPVKKPKKKKGKKKKKDKDTPDPDMTQTGDIGMLLPTSAWLSIGRAMRYYGWVQSITYTHEMFSEDMVPLVTRLQLSFARILTGTPGDFDALDNATAVVRAAAGDNFEVGTSAGTAVGSKIVGSGSGYPDKQGQESNEFYIWNSLLRAGYSKATAGGILGNFEQESGSDPGANQAGGPGRGIAQWSEGGRWDSEPLNCVDWCKSADRNPESLEGQVGFLLKEMGSGSFGSVKKYKSFSDPVDACVYFHDEYEGSADSDAFVREKRGGDARKWFNKFKDKVPATTSAPTSSVFVLGDSLTVGSAPYIRRGYKGTSLSVTIDAEVSRHSSELGPLASDAARGASLWIIALGTNDYSGPDLKDNVRKVMNKAGSGRSVRWINIYNDNNHPQTKTINNALDDMGREYSNLMIIDYAGRLNKSHLDSSGYHLTDTGYRERAKLYVVTVVGSVSASSMSRIG